MSARDPLLLTLYRHAKASRDDATLDDFDRPLTPRGRREARRMARWIAQELPPVDTVLLSPARRTRRTVRALRKATGIRRRQVVKDHGLYLATRAALARRVGLLARGRHVLVVGHNDGLSAFAAWLTDGATGELPTAGVVHLACAVGDWGALRAGCARVVAAAWPVRGDAGADH